MTGVQTCALPIYEVHIGNFVEVKASTIGAGATISREVPAGGLTISQNKQVTVPGWKRPGKAQR